VNVEKISGGVQCSVKGKGKSFTPFTTLASHLLAIQK
jgi:hypothetical protein